MIRINHPVIHILVGLSVFLGIITTSCLVGYAIGVTGIEISIIAIGGICFFLMLVKKILQNIYVLLLLLLLLLEIIMFPDYLSQAIRVFALLVSYVYIFSIAREYKIDVLKIFYRIVVVIAVLSFIVYFLVDFLHFNLPNTYFKLDWLHPYTNYKMLYFSRIDISPEKILGIEFVRNAGIFTEGGMYSVMLNICLMIYLFHLKKNNVIILTIITVVTLSTFSTTGIIVMVCVYLFYYSEKAGKSLRFLFVGISIVIAIDVITNLLNYKETYHSFSYQARTFDVLMGLQLFLQKPFLGWGIQNQEIFNSVQTISVAHKGNSNGIVSLLFQMGVIGNILIFYPVWKLISELIKKGYRNQRIIVFTLIALAVCLASQPFEYAPLGCGIMAIIANKLLGDPIELKSDNGSMV